jgi:hypothetical protein
MSDSSSAVFDCPNCVARYKIVRVEAPSGLAVDREVLCVCCGAPLHGREDGFFLKYFLVERPRRCA